MCFDVLVTAFIIIFPVNIGQATGQVRNGVQAFPDGGSWFGWLSIICRFSVSYAQGNT